LVIYFSYDDGNRLTDVQRDVVTITPTKTPFLSSIRKTKAYNTLHQFPQDSMSVRNDNAVIEGASFSSDTLTTPSWRVNATQIFDKVFDLTSTELWVKGAGIDNQYAYQLQKATKEIATDIETALLKGSFASGTGSLARRLAGVLNWISTNLTAVASGTKLTESFFNGLSELAWDAGGDIDKCYVGSTMKRAISGFTASGTKNVDLATKALVNTVDTYDSDFGKLEITLSRDINNAANDCSVLIIQEDLMRMAIGEEVHELSSEEVGQTKHAKMGVIRGELTLEVRAQAANSLATGFWKIIG